jgi:Serine aminopeptidase, S33
LNTITQVPSMPVFSRLLVEPLYRFMYGRPLDDTPPFLNPDLPSIMSADDPEREERPLGLVLVADGVGGLDLCGTALRYVLGAEGLRYAFHVFPWGHGFGRWLADLTNVTNRDAKAALLADVVRQFRARQPDDPVFLVAKSGGSGVVVKALEQLEENSVCRAVLLSPALSPRYDLTAALRAVCKEMVVFWSPWDVIVLGAGTRLFGTADRVRTASAGLTGFRLPDAASSSPAADSEAAGSDVDRARQYAKLRQVRWAPRMAATGYLGGHVGPDSPIFLRNYVVPLLRAGPDVLC